MPKFRTRRVDVNGMSPEEFERHLRELRDDTLEISVSTPKRQPTMKGNTSAARGHFFGQPGGTLRHRPKK